VTKIVYPILRISPSVSPSISLTISVAISLALALAVSLSFTPNANAAEPDHFELGINWLSHGLDKTAKDSTGAAGSLGPTYYNLQFQTYFGISPRWAIAPEVLWGPDFLLTHKEPGTSVTTSFLIFAMPLIYQASEKFELQAGPAYVSYSVKGPGGTTTLSNGNSTSPFALPGDTQTAKTIALFTGAGFRHRAVHFGLDLMTEGLLSGSRRTYSLLATLSFNAFNF
jgi:hypothetical protein